MTAPHSPFTLEICANGIGDAIAADRAGAQRIELCSGTEIGGLTPSPGLVARVLATVSIPVMVMIRPRGGGFCYSDDEFSIMVEDARAAIRQGAHGIVFGCLTPDRELDVARCQQLTSLTDGQDVVFHRAFDFLSEPIAAARCLADIGVDRILTSGQATTAHSGIDCLRDLVEEMGPQIEIMPGGGVNASNVAEIIAKTGVRQVHAGVAGMIRDRPAKEGGGVSLGANSVDDEGTHRAVSLSKLAELVEVIGQLGNNEITRNC